MVHAPEVEEFLASRGVKNAEQVVGNLEGGQRLEEVSDEVDAVNALKRERQATSDVNWDDASKFDGEKDKTGFRQYEEACERVKSFYLEQHTKQTYDFNVRVRKTFAKRRTLSLSIWQALELLDTLIDDSDPDTELGQVQHLLQTAEAIRRDGKPRWMQVTGLVHDLGKLIHFFRKEGDEDRQWDVVGDTFVVGCAFPGDKIIYGQSSFDANPDTKHPVYSTKYGVYEPGCGIENLMLNWGHDEYLYHVLKDQSSLPPEGLAMIRFHSCYPWHRDGAYREFMKPGDENLLEAVQAFNPYDLYSKSDAPPNKDELRPYYEELIKEFFPPVVEF